VTDSVGKSLTAEEERRLLDACLASRSGAIFPVVTLALSTGMRYDEIRTLRWRQVDFLRDSVTVGKSKTAAGTGRVVPLNARAAAALRSWAALAPDREPEHYIFLRSLETPLTPTTRWEKAWQNALDRADVRCRFHDLRHTACTRMLEAGVPLSVVANLFGWSAATTTTMAKRYGHISDGAQRQAVSALDGPILVTGSAQNQAQSPPMSEALKKAV
jgi:integrase